MKKLLFTLILFVFSIYSTYSQIPNAFSYQAVIRNSTGEVVNNQDVSIRISILQNSESGPAVYIETHSAATNEFGLVTLKIGNGLVVSGVFSPTGWGAALHFLKVEIDPNGGSSFIEMGTTQLLAVPYAFHAQTVENDAVDDADANATNELQTLSINGTQLSLSDGGGTVTLPGSTSPWENSTDGIKYDGGKVGINHDPADDSGALQTWGDDGISLEAVNNSVTFPTIYAQNNSGTAAYFDGELVINDGTQGDGKILTSNADGKASWAEPASNVWTQEGDNIYFNSGKIGIGSINSYPQKLLIYDDLNSGVLILGENGSANLDINRGDISANSYLMHGTDGLRKFYVGLPGNSNNYRISTSSTSLNGLEVESNGNVEITGELEIEGELNVKSNGTANMLPHAYAYILSNQNMQTRTPNVTSSERIGTGQYKISVSNLENNNYIVVVTVNEGVAFLNAAVTAKTSEYFMVAIWDTKNDTYYNGGFSFVLYKI